MEAATMVDGGSSPARPEAWWGVIQSAARQHATTAGVWTAIKDSAQEWGLALPTDMFSAVNRMRALASGITYASERLMRAAPESAITSEHIGQQIYARSPQEMALAPIYHVRFEMHTVTEGVVQTGWYTLEYSGSLPPTVGQLFADVGEYASGLAGAYGVSLSGVGRVEIGAF